MTFAFTLLPPNSLKFLNEEKSKIMWLDYLISLNQYSLLFRSTLSFQIITVEMNRRWSCRLGIRLESQSSANVEGKSITVIKEICRDTLAEKDGRLKAGDRVLMVSIANLNIWRAFLNFLLKLFLMNKKNYLFGHPSLNFTWTKFHLTTQHIKLRKKKAQKLFTFTATISISHQHANESFSLSSRAWFAHSYRLTMRLLTRGVLKRLSTWWE